MLVASVPVKFQQIWASGASGSFITNPVPTPSQIAITPGCASFHDGFVPDNFVPVAAGGIPPFGQDMNGLEYMNTAALQWIMAGGPWVYDSAFQTAVGGYMNGAVIMKATLDGLWRSTVDSNLTNPDAGGAGWIDFASNLSPIANIFNAESSSGGSTTSATFQSAGAVVNITKKRASNSVAFIGVLNLNNDTTSSPNGMLANGRLANNSSGSYAGFGATPALGGASYAATHQVGLASPLLGFDLGTLPETYSARVETASANGTLVDWTWAAILALEFWS